MNNLKVDLTSKEFLTASQEKLCDLCFRIAALYNRRENLIREEMAHQGMRLDIPIKVLLEDLKQWILKNDS